MPLTLADGPEVRLRQAATIEIRTVRRRTRTGVDRPVPGRAGGATATRPTLDIVEEWGLQSFPTSGPSTNWRRPPSGGRTPDTRKGKRNAHPTKTPRPGQRTGSGRVVMEVLGHAPMRTTTDTCSHVMPPSAATQQTAWEARCGTDLAPDPRQWPPRWHHSRLRPPSQKENGLANGVELRELEPLTPTLPGRHDRVRGRPSASMMAL